MANGAPGAPLGNNNAGKARVWTAAIQRALDRRSRADQIHELDQLAELLIDLCKQSDLGALREFGDRMEGKPHQSISGTDGGPMIVEIMKFAK